MLFCLAAFFPVYISANPGGGASEASFGHRLALAANPILAFGVAAFLSKISKAKFFFKAFVCFCCLLVFYKYIQLLQYKIILKYNDPDFTIRTIKNLPFLLENTTFWIRSSSIWNIFPLKNFEFIDIIFLIIFPLLILLGAYLSVIFFQLISTSKGSLNYSLLFLSIILLCLYGVTFSVYKTKSSEEKVNRFIEGAVIKLRRNDPQSSVKYLKEGLKINGTDIRTLNLLGSIYVDILKNNREGVFYFDKSLSASPNQKNSGLIKQKLKSLKDSPKKELTKLIF